MVLNMSSIKKNFAYQSAYQILLILLPFITSPYISRVLGPENTGVFSYSYSVANYFVIFAMLGINNYGNRMIAMVRDERSRTAPSATYSLFILSLWLWLVFRVYSSVKYKTYALIQSLYIIIIYSI